MRNEEHFITAENITSWFNNNYQTISKSEHAYLAESQLKSALKQVLNYVERQNGDWSKVRETEVEVGLVKPNYILQGTVYLINGTGDTVEIVDFKSERKPDLVRDRERIEHYKKQLQVYAHLVIDNSERITLGYSLYISSL